MPGLKDGSERHSSIVSQALRQPMKYVVLSLGAQNSHKPGCGRGTFIILVFLQLGRKPGQQLKGETFRHGLKNSHEENTAYHLALHGLLSYIPVSPYPEVTLSALGWAFPYQLPIKKIPSQASIGQFGEGIFSVEVCSSKMSLVCVKLT